MGGKGRMDTGKHTEVRRERGTDGGSVVEGSTIQQELTAALLLGGEGDKAFVGNLVKGYEHQLRVASRLLLAGYFVSAQPLRIRPTFDVRQDYSDDFDVLFGAVSPECVGSKATGTSGAWVNLHSIEVKSRNVAFDSPEDFPYETIIVETAAAYDKRRHPPDYYVMISQKTNAAIVLKTGGVELIRETKPNRGVLTGYVLAPASAFVSWTDFLASLPQTASRQALPAHA